MYSVHVGVCYCAQCACWSVLLCTVCMLECVTVYSVHVGVCYQARQTRPNSGGVAEGHPRFDKGGVATIFFPFYALKIELFRVFTLSD